MILQYVISLWLVLVFVYSFTNSKVSISLLICYMLFVPIVSIDLGPLHLGETAVLLLLLCITFIKNRSIIKHNGFSPFYPFFSIYLIFFFILPFQSGVEYGYGLTELLKVVLKSFTLPCLMWISYKSDNTVSNLYNKILIYSIIAICLYGLVLTTMPGINPWLISLLPIIGDEFNETYAFSDDGRLFGRISSFFLHPMTFGLFLCLSFIYVLGTKERNKTIINISLLILIFVNIITCGVRSAIAAILLGALFYLLLSRKIKIALTAVFLSLVSLYIIPYISGLENYIGSIFDFNNARGTVSGSSFDMRFEQLDGCFKEIKDCIFIGKGYGWCHYYVENNGAHPVLLCFESLFFSVMCQNGIIGLLAYIYMCVRVYKNKYMCQYEKKYRYIIYTMVFVYLAFSMITGEYGYLKYLLIIYTIFLINNRSVFRI